MKALLKITLLILMAILLQGCYASGKLFQQVEHNQPDKALVYVYRPSHFVNGGAYPNVYVNGINKGSLYNDGYRVCWIDSGMNQITIGGNLFIWDLADIDLNIPLKAGETYFIKASMENSSLFIKRLEVSVIDNETGLKEIKNMKESQ